MARVCRACGREMLDGVACTLRTYGDYADARQHERVPFGSETTHLVEGPEARACHDCGCPRGGLHHPGCDVEQCPICGEQAIGCDCAMDVPVPPQDGETAEDGE